jgi:hypothetical protein
VCSVVPEGEDVGGAQAEAVEAQAQSTLVPSRTACLPRHENVSNNLVVELGLGLRTRIGVKGRVRVGGKGRARVLP